jgi:hypothetical protein
MNLSTPERTRGGMVQAVNQDVDPVALFTADELYDLADEDVLARRRVSPAVYQELQARVRREHRAFNGLVRTVHPRTEAGVDAVYVQVPAPPATPTTADIEAVAAALSSGAQRFLRDDAGGTALAELRTWRGESYFVEFDPQDVSNATCWIGGEVLREGPLAEVIDPATW